MWRRSAAAPPRSYQLLTRAGCHLCDEMKLLLAEVLPRRGMDYEAVDIDGAGEASAALRGRYGDVVPVLLRDGVAVAKVRLERKQLERILDGKR